MSFQVYNTLSRKKEEFQPNDPNRVSMYVCGPNLYGPAHIGHALSYIIFDTLKRYLKFRGYQVRHVQNFTDIEDRIIETARTQNTTIQALAEKYIHRFLQEMEALNILAADIYPRATASIPTIIEMNKGLIARGSAYTVDGDVYYRVRADADYGKLSRRTLDEMQAGARVAVDERKEDPLDFVLWKSAKPGEPSWDSPWGPGRPGWHIECSAMNLEFQGPQIDIHGGGYDVIFPHHENEIAQSESFTGKAPFVKYWVHNALLHLPGKEKMTRHEGGLIEIPDALSRHSADAIRAFILNTHYRSPLAWTEEGVEGTERGLDRLRAAVEDHLAVEPASAAQENALTGLAAETRARFIAAMDDDLNSPMALGLLFDLAREINRARAEGVLVADLAPAQATLRELAGVFGLTLKEPERTVSEADAVAIEGLVQKRNALRSAKKFAEADQVRAELAAMGVVLEDTSQGTTWKKIK
ncbi:MAG: cysteine--tRNA ligase [Anaerolineae bacterium]